MTTPWSSLYCPSDDPEAVTRALRESLSGLGYELYNPFGLMPGKAYRQSVKLFAAPAAGGWVRVVGTLDERQFAQVSQSSLCLYITLDASAARIAAHVDGQPADAASALSPYLRPGRSIDELRKALAGEIVVQPVAGSDEQVEGLPLAALPDDVKALAGRVNPAQAQKLFSRLSADVLKKVSGDSRQVEDARALLGGDAALDWNSPAGQQLRAFMACLTVPDKWREPDFMALRDAYPLYERLRRNPNARLYPGDDVLMAAVPDALDYSPVYGGIV
jgi:hypothetical protein